METESVANFDLAIQEEDQNQQLKHIKNYLKPQVMTTTKDFVHVSDFIGNVAGSSEIQTKFTRHSGGLTYTNTDQNNQNKTGHHCQSGFHPRAKHCEITIVKKCGNNQQTVETVAGINSREHDAGKCRVGHNYRQACNDDSEKMAWNPTGQKAHQPRWDDGVTRQTDVSKHWKQNDDFNDNSDNTDDNPRHAEREADEATNNDKKQEDERHDHVKETTVARYGKA